MDNGRRKAATALAKADPAALAAAGFRTTRKISEIIVHCSATRPGQGFTADDIRRWHVSERGFSDIGYHFVVETDGTVSVGRSLDLAGRTAGGITHGLWECAIWVESVTTGRRQTRAQRRSARRSPRS